MKFALSKEGKRIKANKHTGGFCEMCGEPLIPRCGSIKIHHWAHKAGKDCDHWWEPETDWHRDWKNLVDEDFRERVIGKNGVRHRADIRLLSGIVIELQNSPLSFEERCEREHFYENMIWIIHLPNAKIEIIEYCFKKSLFNDYYAKIENINEWIFRPPHSCPIFLDLDENNRIFHVTEFSDDYSTKKRSKYLYGNYIDKKKFIKFLKPTFFDFDLSTINLSQKHREELLNQQQKQEKQKQRYRELLRKKQEEWQKEREKVKLLEHEEENRIEQERKDPKKREMLRIMRDNEKWGLLKW